MSEESRNLNYTAPRPRPDAGYAFDKWVYEDGTPVDFSTDTVSEYGTVLIAQFIPSDAPYVPQQFTITFVAGANGTLSGQTVFMVTEGEDGTAPLNSATGGFKVPTTNAASGYLFKEWQTNDCAINQDLGDELIYADTTYTAIFARDPATLPKTFIATFIYHDGSSQQKTVMEGTPIGAPPIGPALRGYRISSWKDNAGKVYTAAQVVGMQLKQHITLTAIYTPSPR